MSTSPPGRLLHVRSLNSLWRDHVFTYVGARVLAESLHPEIIDAWTNGYICRRAHTRRRQVYWKHSLFKGFGRDERPEYRKCVIGSPTTHLTEVWLLTRLSQEAAFAQHPCVYSYFWGHEKSTHLFRYFFKGYMEREHRIARAAAELKDPRVVVLDLKRFYPSIAVSKVRGRFARRLGLTGFSPSERDTAIQCVEDLTSIKNEVGLPIGPPLSHALANVFLEEFDQRLFDAFGECYFRYVDDIAIVVPRGKVDFAQRLFGEIAAGEGLEVNSAKVDILTGEDWSARVRHREQSGEDHFVQLVSDLRRYLAHNTDDFDRVRDLFRADGFALPFSRLRSVASSGPFRRFMKSLWSQTGGVFGRSVPRPSALLMRANRLRREFKDRLRLVSERPLPSGGMARRWAIQDFRYLLNRSLYLLPPESRGEILGLIPDCLELRPSKAVLAALVTGDASDLTRYPGPTVSAFCELWMETRAERPTFTWSPDPRREERDGVSVLALCGLCTPPDEWTNHLRERSSRVMVNLSARQRPTRRSFDDFSYIDEMESLFRMALS